MNRSFFESSLREGARIVTSRGPRLTSLEALWPTSGDACLWITPDGGSALGMGVTDFVRREGAGRFAPLHVAELPERREPGVDAPPPRLYGGFSFAEGASVGPWAGFGDGWFVRPRWEIGVSANGDGYIRFSSPEEIGRDTSAALAELSAIWSRAETAHAPVLDRATPASVRLPFEPWRSQVESIQAAITEGTLDKAVASTRAHFVFDRAIDVPRVLMHLRARFAGCTIFAFRRGDITFLGATPENLLRRRGDSLHTEALAGSAAPDDAEQLARSVKDHHEHRLVVDAIVGALEPFADAIDVDATRVHELPNVAHLRTPIRARVREASTLPLVGALHPTPAVGGTPREAALRWITTHEPPRGWYASPIGWIDASGDASFAVALRCGLVREREAWAFAGCGIVEGSVAEREHAEVRMKLGAFVDAIQSAAVSHPLHARSAL